jgi:hypothetical protein
LVNISVCLSVYLSIYLSIYLSVIVQPLCWTLAAFQFLSLLHSQKVSLDGGSACCKAATYTHRTAQTEYMHTDIHVSSGIRIHDHSVWMSEDSSCLRLCGHCDQQANIYRGQMSPITTKDEGEKSKKILWTYMFNFLPCLCMWTYCALEFIFFFLINAILAYKWLF